MEENLVRRKTFQAVNFAIVITSLVLIAVVLGVLLALTMHGAAQAEGKSRDYLLRLAWLTLAVLVMTILLLGWVIVHRIALAHQRGGKRSTPPYINAWSLAGKRFCAEEEDEDPDEDEQDRQEQ